MERTITPSDGTSEPTRTFNTTDWARLVKERDGGRCQFEGCGATDNLEAHHLLPLAQGGLNTLENGITLCREHHRREYLRLHLRVHTEAKTSRLFSKRPTGKREAAYRFLSRKRMMERARPHGRWRTDRTD